MKITELIEELQCIKSTFGDIPCLIEVDLDYVSCDTEINECSVEDRAGYGLSVKFLM